MIPIVGRLQPVDPDLRRTTPIAAKHGIGRVVAVHRQANESDRGKGPVALAILGDPKLPRLTACAAGKAENYGRVRCHRSFPKAFDCQELRPTGI